MRCGIEASRIIRSRSDAVPRIATDPSGLFGDLLPPGGNVTGFTDMSSEIIPKTI
jgi:hypothetical protein